jgi:hypothetical protein
MVHRFTILHVMLIFAQLEGKKREEYLKTQERKMSVDVGHRLSDHTGSLQSNDKGQKSTKSSRRPGIEYSVD